MKKILAGLLIIAGFAFADVYTAPFRAVWTDLSKVYEITSIVTTLNISASTDMERLYVRVQNLNFAVSKDEVIAYSLDGTNYTGQVNAPNFEYVYPVDTLYLKALNTGVSVNASVTVFY